MDAPIDFMSYIDNSDAGISAVTVKENEGLEINILATEETFKNCLEMFQEFIECTAFVNQRFIETHLER